MKKKEKVLISAEEAYELGNRYDAGNGVAQDRKKAMQYWRQAVKDEPYRWPEVQYRMARCYYKGDGVKQSDIQARKRFRLTLESIKQNDWENASREELEKLIKMRTIATKLDKELRIKIKRDQEERRNAKAHATLLANAQAGDVTACYHLGMRYYNGEYVSQNYEEAVKWLSTAAEKLLDKTAYLPEGSDGVWALYWLGQCYLKGFGVEKDVLRATTLWECAVADWGCRDFIMELVDLYRDGSHRTPDDQKAAYWLSQAALAGIPEAQYQLGICYYTGKGVARNEETARDCFDLAVTTFEKEGAWIFDSAKRAVYLKARKMAAKLGNLEIVKEFRAAARWGNKTAQADWEELKHLLYVPVSVGEKLWHNAYGEGVICENNGEFFTVEFSSEEKMTFWNPQSFEEGYLFKAA